MNDKPATPATRPLTGPPHWYAVQTPPTPPQAPSAVLAGVAGFYQREHDRLRAMERMTNHPAIARELSAVRSYVQSQVIRWEVATDVARQQEKGL